MILNFLLYLFFDGISIYFILNYVLQAGEKMTKEIITQYQIFMSKHNWTQTEAAEKIGCSQEHLSRIFRGLKNPSVKLIDKMEEVMKRYG